MESRGISSATNRSPYVLAPPSEPTIISPYRSDRDMVISPSAENAAAIDLTPEQYNLITSNRSFRLSDDSDPSWDYSQRRRAHAILEWLHLGPYTVLRDEKFLKEAGITTVIPVRYVPDPGARSIFNNIGANAVTRALGINTDPVDVESDMVFPGIFPVAVKKINDAVLAHARDHPLPQTAPDARRHNARVLIVCETGNHRSALVVAAYLTAMFAMPLHDTLTYLSTKRFSADLEDVWKRHIMTWSEILQAKRDVNSSAAPTVQPAAAPTNKRSIDDTFQEDWQHDLVSTGGMAIDTSDRPEDRKFVPFMDSDDSMM